MSLLSRALSWAVAGFVFCSAAALADCREDPRETHLGGSVVRLKSFVCREPGNTEDSIKVEFYRLSDTAASIMLQGVPSDTLGDLLGSPKLIETDVARAYGDLLRQFGSVMEPERAEFASFLLETARVAGSEAQSTTAREHFSGNPKVLREWEDSAYFGSMPFPALEESRLLAKGKIPPGYNFFYSCELDQCPPEKSELVVWRAMTSSDVIDFPKKVRQYNKLFHQKSDHQYENTFKQITPRFLKLLDFIAEGKWPHDFIMIYGPEGNTCGDMGGLLSYYPREILVDFVLVENLAPSGLTLDSLIFQTSTERNLRLSTRFSSGDRVMPLPSALAPGGKLLVPTKISLFPSKGTEKYQTTNFKNKSSAVFRRLGMAGFSGNSNYSVPSFNKY